MKYKIIIDRFCGWYLMLKFVTAPNIRFLFLRPYTVVHLSIFSHGFYLKNNNNRRGEFSYRDF